MKGDLCQIQSKKPEIVTIDLDAITAKKIEKLGKALKALMYEEPTNCCLLPKLEERKK